jgi:hypothetical protein
MLILHCYYTTPLYKRQRYQPKHVHSAYVLLCYSYDWLANYFLCVHEGCKMKEIPSNDLSAIRHSNQRQLRPHHIANMYV